MQKIKLKLKGRPGWHIECSVMSSENLGQPFDIHTGGIDLIFPHHENEIAQSEGATGKRFVKYWFHNEWLLVEGKKMSKSLGNFYTLRDLLDKGYDAAAVRYVLLGTHYRQQLNFTFEELAAAKNSLQRLWDFMDRIDEVNEKNNKGNEDVDKLTVRLTAKLRKEFESAMDEDLEISKALAAVFDFVREINKIELSKKDADNVKKAMLEIDSVLGVIKREKEELSYELIWMITQREEARKKKDYSKADKIRNELKEKGIILEDTSDGVRWKRV